MVFQLTVHGPRGKEKVVDLCDSEEQLKRITVLHLKKKIVHELFLGEAPFCLVSIKLPVQFSMRLYEVPDVKIRAHNEFCSDDDIRMVFRTETLEESSLLMSYGIKHLSNIYTLLMLPGGL